MSEASPTKPSEPDHVKAYFDRGHQGDVDRTQIAELLKLTPTERLRRHERWRRFIKNYAGRLLRNRHPDAGSGAS